MERRQIVQMGRQGDVRVLVTLVRTEGSSYRRPGARLLIGDAANYAGTISGGCLETEVVRKATWMVRDGAVVQRYSMLFDDTSDIPFGLGCGGVVDLLMEPMGTPEATALLAAMERSLEGVESTVVTFFPGEGRPLRRLVLSDIGEVIFASAALSQTKIDCARGLEPGGDYDGRFVERLLQPQRIVVLGAGDDVRPVAAIAASLGWNVVVADGRPQLARAERFPAAQRVTVIGSAAELNLRERDAVVLMTHSYEQDRDLLAGILALDHAPRYVGLLGARHRSSVLVSEAAVMAGCSVRSACERLFAPVGLDLGGDGPEAIALAIVAEIQAFCNGRLGSSRKLTTEEIAQQLERGGSTQYLQAQCALDAAG